MLALAGRQQIDLPSSRRQSAGVLAAHAEQDQFGDVAKIEPDTATVRAAVLADFVPNDVGFVSEAPRFQHREPFGQHRVRAPQIKVGCRRRQFRNGQRHDFVEPHGAVARQAFVLRRDFPGFVGELPRRISENSREAATLGEADEIVRSSARRDGHLPVVDALGLPHRPGLIRHQAIVCALSLQRQGTSAMFQICSKSQTGAARPHQSNL